MCLDEIDSPGGRKLHIGAHTIFPVQDNSIKMINTSHHLEHQDDKIVDQILIVIKIPDFDLSISHFINNNYQNIKGKGIESVAWSWKSMNVEISYLNAFSMMFCGYWNKSYGDHFRAILIVQKMLIMALPYAIPHT